MIVVEIGQSSARTEIDRSDQQSVFGSRIVASDQAMPDSMMFISVVRPEK